MWVSSFTFLSNNAIVLFRHIYAIGNAAHETMLRTEHKQAIVISGESGAGKTESTRLLVEFLAAINRTNGNVVTKQVHIKKKPMKIKMFDKCWILGNYFVYSFGSTLNLQ